MSRRGSYLGGHSIITIKKKNKKKASISPITKTKKNWPYKTIKPDQKPVDLIQDNKLIINHLKTYLAINKRRIKKNLDKEKINKSLLDKLIKEKANIEQLIKIKSNKSLK